MTTKEIQPTKDSQPPVLDPAAPKLNVKFSAPTDEDMGLISALRASSSPWK